MKTSAFLLLAVLFLASPSLAATVHFENGDRLTGDIVEINGGKLHLETSSMGVVPVDLGAVKSIATDAPFSAILASGDLVTGSLVAAGKGRVKITSATGAHEVALADIRRMKPAPEILSGQDAHEAALALFAEPEKSPWSGQVELAGHYSSGNTDRRGYGIAVTAVRDTPADRFKIKASTLYGEEDGDRTTNEQHLTLREDLKFDPWYAFLLLDFERDEFENLDLRAILAPGVGRIFADSDDFKLKAELGPTLTYEDYKDDDGEFDIEARLGVDAMLKVLGDAELTESFAFYPNLSDAGEYRWTSETAFTKPLSEVLFFKVSALIDYNTDVDPGVKRRDFKLLASLIFKF